MRRFDVTPADLRGILAIVFDYRTKNKWIEPPETLGSEDRNILVAKRKKEQVFRKCQTTYTRRNIEVTNDSLNQVEKRTATNVDDRASFPVRA